MRTILTGVLGCLAIFVCADSIAESLSPRIVGGPESVISHNILLPNWLKEIQGVAEISIGRVSIAGNEIDNLRIPIQIREGKFTAAGSGQIGREGDFIFQWTQELEQRTNEISVVAKSVPSTDLSLFTDNVSALFNLRFEITGGGNSLAEILSVANGLLTVDVERGTLASNDLERAGSDLLSYVVAGLNPFATRDTTTHFRCAKARFDLVAGKAHAERIIGLQTEHFTMMCGGELDFGAELTALQCRPQQHFELVPDGLSVVESIDVTGTFANPRMSVNKLGILERGASLGVGITGLGLNQLSGLLRRAESGSVGSCEILLGN
jgi:hypothetical protein